MSNRLSIPDIAGLLAEYSGADKKMAERFLKEFVHVVRDAVFEDKIVKIKGLGTFKIIEVQDRESVDVNTGKRILIPGHYKFSFIPDKDLKEEVNKPFSFFETVEISDHVDSASMEHEHPEEIEISIEKEETVIDEPEQLPEQEKIEEPEAPEEEKVEEITEITSEEDIPETETLQTDESSEELQEPDEPEEDMRPGFFIPKVESRQEEVVENVSKPDTGKSGTLRIISIAAVFIFAIAGGLFFFFNRDTLSAWNRSSIELDLRADSIANNIVNEKFLSEDSLDINVDETVDLSASEDLQNLSSDNTETATSPGTESQPESSTGNKDIIASVKIEPGNRLTLLALEYYGEKVFWVYLYEYNKDIIKDPNNIPVGRVIQIPAAEYYNINPNSKASLEKATLLQSQILQAL